MGGQGGLLSEVMNFIFGKPEMPNIPEMKAPTLPNTQRAGSNAEQKAANQQRRQAAANRTGNTNVYAGLLTEEPEIKRKTLLGG